MIVIGLTGSIGMGKSVTAKMFALAGIPVYDADAAVHRLYAGSAAPLIEKAFPGTTRNGTVDRQLLSNQVLGDSIAIEKLERIIHPLVRGVEKNFLRKSYQSGYQLVCLDIPLLFESKSDHGIDAAVVVSASAEIQKQRVLARDGMTEERFQYILDRQTPDAEKRRRAHFLVDSGHGLSAAERQVAAIIRAVSGMSGKKPCSALQAAMTP